MKNKKKDFIIAAVFLVLALSAFMARGILFPNEGELYCEIYVDGNLIETVALTEDQIFSLEECPTITFEIRDHGIAFAESDCPDKICIHSGFLNQNGETASCLPNKTTIRICGENDVSGAPDVIIGFIDGARDEE